MIDCMYIITRGCAMIRGSLRGTTTLRSFCMSFIRVWFTQDSNHTICCYKYKGWALI